MKTEYAIGLDYGTNSVRALLVDVSNGAEIAASVWNYAHGTQGVILGRDPTLARQHPADYLEGAQTTIQAVLETARQTRADFAPEQVIGIGVDTTGSTPLPVDESGSPLAFQEAFATIPTRSRGCGKTTQASTKRARITELARQIRPQYSPNAAARIRANGISPSCGTAFETSTKKFSMRRIVGSNAPTDSGDFNRNSSAQDLTIGVCAAGHKAMWNSDWGWPDADFLSALHPKLRRASRAFVDESRNRRKVCRRTHRRMGAENRTSRRDTRGGWRFRRTSGRRGRGHRARNTR
jgi:L-ribulokinase